MCMCVCVRVCVEETISVQDNFHECKKKVYMYIPYDIILWLKNLAGNLIWWFWLLKKKESASLILPMFCHDVIGGWGLGMMSHLCTSTMSTTTSQGRLLHTQLQALLAAGFT